MGITVKKKSVIENTTVMLTNLIITISIYSCFNTG